MKQIKLLPKISLLLTVFIFAIILIFFSSINPAVGQSARENPREKYGSRYTQPIEGKDDIAEKRVNYTRETPYSTGTQNQPRPGMTPLDIRKEAYKESKNAIESRRAEMLKESMGLIQNSASPLNSEGSATLYFYPPNITLNKGETTSVFIKLDNFRGRKIDEIKMAIDWDPTVLDVVNFIYPIAGNEIQSFSTREVLQSRINPQAGTINFHGYSGNRHLLLNGDVAQLVLKAKQPVYETELRFSSGLSLHDPDTTVKYKGIDFLGMRGVNWDGMIRCFIKILEPEKGPASIGDITTEYLLKNNTDETILPVNYLIDLELNSKTRTMKTGDQVEINVLLRNHENTFFDSVDLRVQYDPAVFKALDADLDNWVSNGINIYDGAAHDIFDFDYHIINRIDASAGIIDYREKSINKDIDSSGVLATIYLEALKPAAKTEIGIIPIEETTGVFKDGRQLVNLKKLKPLSLSIE